MHANSRLTPVGRRTLIDRILEITTRDRGNRVSLYLRGPQADSRFGGPRVKRS